SIEDTMKKYAPPSENNTEQYIRYITSATGLDRNTKMGSLSKEQLDVFVSTIRRVEGWKEGKEIPVS
ncbi:integrating conjugative element protein, partial [Gallibacterium sp. AGMB14963]|nr:integrating conjugative element protein [Gallibacterium sp. AGMB14963]